MFIMILSVGVYVIEGMGSYMIGKFGVSRLVEILYYENK